MTKGTVVSHKMTSDMVAVVRYNLGLDVGASPVLIPFPHPPHQKNS